MFYRPAPLWAMREWKNRRPLATVAWICRALLVARRRMLVMVMAGVARTVRGPSMVPLLHFSCMSLCCLFFLPNNFFRRYC
jgi:hypothetical protein